MDIKILCEDKFLLVAEKPAAMLSEPSPKGTDIVTALNEQTGENLLLVHRLDANTGGAMAFAKNPHVAGKLSAEIQERSFTKEYLAVCEGVPEKAEGVMKDLLFKDSKKNKTFIVSRERKGVKEASLEYKLLSTAENEHGEKISLVRVLLHTGRTHQIRVQFAGRKMPLVGDGKYGSKNNRCETALWSYHLAFKHPVTGKNTEVFSLPQDEYPWSFFTEEIKDLGGQNA